MAASPREATAMKLELRGVVAPLHEFDLTVDLVVESPATGLLGPSGAGKTTLLDLIAGLRRPARGEIRLDGEVFFSSETRSNLAARLRRVGYVPQDLALFPHYSVRRNLLYGARPGDGSATGSTLERVCEVLELARLLDRRADQLSGGEAQRVALGRALLSQPRLLLLDEPLASLDAALKGRIMPYLRRARDEFKTPMLYVTHQASEAEALCEELIFLERGRVTNRSPGG
jgi:molybdate transport system ATP-binding protein